jgi:mannose/fructose-specific phosphotransferase system component IIA
VAGVNLPMLLKAITQRRRPVDEVVEELIAAGQRAIRLAEPEVEKPR